MVLLGVVLLGVAFFFIRLAESSWVCKNGQWIKHGWPRIDKPNTLCAVQPKTNNSTDKETAVAKECSVEKDACGAVVKDAKKIDFASTVLKPELINITEPAPNASIKSPLKISGQARDAWFENSSFGVFVVDRDSNLVASGTALAQVSQVNGDFITFTAELRFLPTPATSGKIFAVPGGSQNPLAKEIVEIPIKFTPVDKLKVLLYFANTTKANADCSTVFSVEREISVGSELYTTLDSLIMGPTSEEKEAGYVSYLTAAMTFNEVGSSLDQVTVKLRVPPEILAKSDCTLPGIRAQITETAKQFPNVEGVEVLINDTKIFD
ncbi:MAG: hypothetical protein UW45_C0039G0002 [Parcubacteria group bacterium GW2011_GWC2_44_22]|nr:MAG: hypothetical protein UW45_C0039G0002 [Parcubacteria group bacterium GW2011_GWC2_44_22]